MVEATFLLLFLCVCCCVCCFSFFVCDGFFFFGTLAKEGRGGLGFVSLKRTLAKAR